MKNRTEAYKNIAGKHFTLCVVGGGATGAACALEAQLRGIDTVLLEANDFASATSSASTKIVHGGVRYLEQAIKSADLQEYHVLVRALHERVHMLENAPHLTRKLDFIVPSYSWIDIAYLDIGLKLYDWLAGPGRISPSQYLSRVETIRRMPNVNQTGLIGSVIYADGQFDDARYNIALAQTFTMAGGNALNYARVTGFLRDDKERIHGVVASEPFSDRVFEVHADCVVNATGPASDSLRQLASPKAERRIRPSKGAHILLPLDVFPTSDALLIPKTEDGRVLFVIPWGGRLLVGTTEEEVSADTVLRVTKEDVAYMLRHVNQYLANQVTPADIVSGFAGARPLVSGADNESGSTKSLARDDVIEVDTSSGLISVMGGKWTTHRAMAEDAINLVQQFLQLPDTPSRTRDHVLYGGGGYRGDFWESLCRQHGVAEETARHLATKFGTAAEHILMIAAEHPTLREPIITGHPAIRAEIVYCVRYELAFSIEDVLARRLGIQLYSWRYAIDAAPVVGAVMASELGWETAYRDQAIEQYTHNINLLLTTAGLEPYHALEQSTCPVPAGGCTEDIGQTSALEEQLAKYIGAIDQGTTSTRFIVFDRSGSVVSIAQKEHRQIFPQPGWVEHDAGEIWLHTCQVVAEAMDQASFTSRDLAAIGITNQRETAVVWNRKTGKPVCNALVWQDTRVAEYVAAMEKQPGQDWFRRKTGLPLATYFSGLKIRWILEHVQGVRELAEKGEVIFGNIDTFLLWQLTGGIDGGVHVTDVTNASRTQMMDLHTLSWDAEILDAFGIPAAMLPRICSSSEVYGFAKIRPIADVPIAGILGDQQSALVGQACFERGEAKNTYGTGCFLLMNTGTEKILSKSGLITTVAYKFGTQPVHYALEGSIAMAGALVQWVRDNLGLIQKSSDIETLANSVTDNGGVYFVPAFAGLYAPYWNEGARGVIAGLTRYANRGHIARAVLESTAYQTRDVLEAMEKDSGIRLDTLRSDGGMASDEVFMQFQADILNRPVVRPRTKDATTAVGAAYAAGLAVQYFASIEDLRRNWVVDRTWIPRLAQGEREDLYRHWKRAVARSFDWLD